MLKATDAVFATDHSATAAIFNRPVQARTDSGEELELECFDASRLRHLLGRIGLVWPEVGRGGVAPFASRRRIAGRFASIAKNGTRFGSLSQDVPLAAVVNRHSYAGFGVVSYRQAYSSSSSSPSETPLGASSLTRLPELYAWAVG